MKNLELASEKSCSTVEQVRNRIFLCWGFLRRRQTTVCFQLLSGRQRSGLDECLRFSSVLLSCKKLEEKVCHPEEWEKVKNSVIIHSY